jgi:hypothetical protein
MNALDGGVILDAHYHKQRYLMSASLSSHPHRHHSYKSLSRNPPLCWFWKTLPGSYFSATSLSFCTLAAPYDAIGFWSRDASLVKMKGMSRPRSLLSCFMVSVTPMGTERTAASSAAAVQSTSVVHPDILLDHQR